MALNICGGLGVASNESRRVNAAVVTLLGLALSTLLSSPVVACSPCSSSPPSSFLFSLVPVPACRDYALCFRGLALRVLPCPQGTAFDPVQRICTSALHQPCLVTENQAHPRTQLSCPSGAITTYYPDYSHGCPSPSYFRCKNGVISGQSCPDTRVFDEGTDTCLRSSVVVCGTTGPVCSEKSHPSAAYANYARGCPTNQFTMCLAGGSVDIKCPTGLFYNGAMKNCDYPDSVICGYNVFGLRKR